MRFHGYDEHQPHSLLTVVNALYLSIVINENIQSIETIVSGHDGSRRQDSMIRGQVLDSYNLVMFHG